MNGRASIYFRRVCGQAARMIYPLRWPLLFFGALLLLQGSFSDLNRAQAQAAADNGLRLLTPVVQGTNLWLGLEGEPDGRYDLFSSTNLNSGSRWRWETRSATPGQSGFLVPKVSGPARVFQLGTLFDGDTEGLTDAFELLVTKTNPLLSDTDGDGVGDYAEYLQGRNPLAGAVPDIQNVVRLRVFTPMP